MPKTQKCTECGKPSLPGLTKGNGKCQYHWTRGVWGKEWADHCAKLESSEPKESKQ